MFTVCLDIFCLLLPYVSVVKNIIAHTDKIPGINERKKVVLKSTKEINNRAHKCHEKITNNHTWFSFFYFFTFSMHYFIFCTLSCKKQVLLEYFWFLEKIKEHDNNTKIYYNYFSRKVINFEKNMFYSYRPIVGACFIIIGVLILIATIGQLIFKIITALFALALINIGLHLYHLPTLRLLFSRWLFRRY